MAGKVARKSRRIDDRPPYGVRGVPLGYGKAQTFRENITNLYNNAQESPGRPAWRSEDIHFKLNRLYRNWKDCAGKDFAAGEGVAYVNRLKAWVEQQWPASFMTHATATSTCSD